MEIQYPIGYGDYGSDLRSVIIALLCGSPLEKRTLDLFHYLLPDNADLDSVSTKLEDGVLMVVLPKLAGPRVVSIISEDNIGDKEKLQESSSKAKKVDL
ncbi:hypothetical protein C4D60_Mb01t31840 [Musa balbisiana]|uniref:SHSP domain-containing protein n=1 Tax=Musa balbisiana TaxID=52838 RepID=A0A4S8JS84_MUSBA|nr:hypothetical protein C4D60_Mb01t31840 [Musa balbisiana]